MAISQAAKAAAFKALHQQPGAFLLPNPWNAGTAKILAAAGFQALATTSAGLAFCLGQPDGVGAISREETLQNMRSIVEATDLPVSADLENCFADEPQACAAVIKQAAQIGLAGGSIEDATGCRDDPIYPFALAVERVAVAVQAAGALPYPFVLTARAENLMWGRLDLRDTIKRLEAFAAAGADVLYAPGLRTLEEVDAVVRAVAPKPVNVVVGVTETILSIAELSALGVKRISLGSTLARTALGAFIRAIREMKENGTFQFATQAISEATIVEMFDR